jgi:alkanesulfonate monooxygenase SsuD/methylene tetrahydromethanopterin reductase-like flavin-dependent oxidoreductase (luciferase family)
VKNQLAACGRQDNQLHIFQGVSVIVGDDADDVEQQYQTTAALVSIEDALNYLGAISNTTTLRSIRWMNRSPILAISGKTASAAPPMKLSATRANAD